ncbi:hypothetical protein LINPERHAP2_LOCUS3782 [Linum perenne]
MPARLLHPSQPHCQQLLQPPR